MDYMENLRRSPVFRNSFEPSMSMGKEHHGHAGSSPIEVNLPSFAQDMEHLHLPRRHDTSASTLEAEDFSSPSAYAPEPFGPKEKKADEMPVLDERQVTIIVLLARVCSVYDATPKTFVANVLRLHRMGVLESIAFLSDLGLLASSTSPRKMDAIEQWDVDKGGVGGGMLGFPQSLNVSRYARDFDEVRLIGQGGFGQVYMARHKLDGICYAIKQVRFFNKGFQSPLVQNVLREVHCLARCDHPNVNRYYSAWLEPTWVPMNLHTTSYTAPPTSAPIINPVELQTKNPHLLEDIYRFVDAKSDSSDVDGHTTSNLELSEDHYTSSYSVSRDSYESSNGSVVEFEFDRDVSQSNFSCTSFSDLPAYDPKSANSKSNVSVTSSSTVHRRRSQSFESSTHASQLQLATYQATHTIVSDWNSVNSLDARTLQLQRKRQQSWCADTPFRNHRAGSFLAIEGDAPPSSEIAPAFTYQITLYIQMFLCEQSTLQDWLDERNRNVGHVDFQASLRLFRQLVNGIKHVHENGIIHRDLKPSNVFMTRDGALKIGDFGLSKLLAEVMADDPINNRGFMPPASGHGHTQGVGTMSYASPEQVAGTDYDHKVDSFSLGIILLELFCVFDTKMERARALKDVRANPQHVPDELATSYPEIAALISHLVAPTCTRWTVEQAHDYLCTTFPQVHLEKAREVLELRQQLHENEAKLKEQDALIEELRRQVATLSQDDTNVHDPRMAR